MKLGFIADVHLNNYKLGSGKYVAGCNERSRGTASAIRSAVNDYGLDELWILGDLFDIATPSPQIVALMMKALDSSECRKRLIRGNHDMSSLEAGDNALAPLAYLSNTKVYEEPSYIKAGGLTVLALPFPYKPFDMPPLKAVDIVVMHHGISDPDTPDFMDNGISYTELLDWMDSQPTPVPLLLSGDWHEHKKFCRGRIIQVGVFAPKGMSDAFEVAGCMAVVDTDADMRTVNGVMVPRVKMVEVPGPRFATTDTKEEAVELAKKLLDQGCTPFINYPQSGAVSGEAPPVVEGAVIRPAAPKTVHQEALAKGDEARDAASKRDEKALLKSYLKHTYPDTWKSMYKTIIAEMRT